jgi:hypothetical protein
MVSARAQITSVPGRAERMLLGSRPLGGYGSLHRLVPRAVAIVALLAALFLLAAPSAGASQRLGLVDTGEVTLLVDRGGAALIGYTTGSGMRRQVLAWGDVDAAPPGEPERALRLDYSAGGRKASFADGCLPYDGPPLVYLIAACRAPDGSYWALQRWQRVQPLRGVAPFRPEHSAYELRVSHWTGPLGLLEVSPNWSYDGALQGLFGRLSYRGVPTHGTRTPSASRADLRARYVYIDTFNSAYGPGWKREAAKVTHVASGGFCYSFAPIPPPPGYPADMPKVRGNGERHRVTVVGPGLTPDLQWEGQGLGSFDAALDVRFNQLFDQLLAGDRACSGER